MVGTTRIAGQEIPLTRFTGFPPCAEARGDIDAMSLLARQSVGLVNDIRPVAELVQDLVDGATALIRHRLAGIAAGSAP